MKYLIIGSPDFLVGDMFKSLSTKSTEFMFLDPSIRFDSAISKLGKTITADTDNEYAIKTTFSSFKPDVVFYSSSPVLTPSKFYSPVHDYAHFMRSSIALTQALDMYGTGRVYLASSYEVYGATGTTTARKKISESDRPLPVSLRGAYLDAAENLFRIVCSSKSIGLTSLRYFEIVGPDATENPPGMIQGAVRSVLSGRTVVAAEETRKLDFISYDDALVATKKIIKSGIVGPINVGTGYGTPVKKMFSQIKKMSGRKNSVVFHPNATASKFSAVADTSKLHKIFIPRKISIEDISALFDFYKGDI